MSVWIGVVIFVAVVVAIGGVAFFIQRRSSQSLAFRDLDGHVEEATGLEPDTRVPAPPARRSLADRLAKSRDALGSALRSVFGPGTLDSAFWEGIEDALVSADVGVAAATEIVAAVRESGPETTDDARTALRSELLHVLERASRELTLIGSPAKVVVVGVNGAGKTTTIAKLAARLSERGFKPILGAADTFRAAADEQLRMWADRVGVEVIGGEPGADPASVAYDALQAGRARGNDVVVIDTAGRLQNKSNLMAELGKIVRVVERDSEPVSEVLLVVDATTGQNGLSQAKQFTEVVGVTGIVLTKLDGTAKGGVVVAIERETGIPVKYIGVGEGVEDLIQFEPAVFVDALLGSA
ncbi:MAG: signal recognition particle-docking protein FtsY [Acidimicrobiia bacterium]|nr:signal recognition particle-docking protein FtsY [Acidimicrobiia bacterium]